MQQTVYSSYTSGCFFVCVVCSLSLAFSLSLSPILSTRRRHRIVPFVWWCVITWPARPKRLNDCRGVTRLSILVRQDFRPRLLCIANVFRNPLDFLPLDRWSKCRRRRTAKSRYLNRCSESTQSPAATLLRWINEIGRSRSGLWDDRAITFLKASCQWF